MDSFDPEDQAFVTELHIICRAEHAATVRAQLPHEMEMAEVPGWLPRGFAGRPGLVTLFGAVPDGAWTSDAQHRLDELAQQGIILQQGTGKHSAEMRFVTFDELLSGKYAGQLVAVRPWDMPRLDQLPPGVTMVSASRRLQGMSMPPHENE